MIKILLFLFACLHSNAFPDTTIVAIDQVHHSFGNAGNNRTTTHAIQFPSSAAEYSSIKMKVNLECPNGGCDPWDRKAKISVYHLDQWFEIGRYVTPYGIECGWEIDVSDYRSILKNEVLIKSYIDTWVEPGWLVSVEFDFISGINAYAHTIVRNLWNYDRLVYGDPSIPIDIATINEYLPTDTEEAYIRITTTGHGQGNTENAAEFSDKQHNILINGQVSHVHNFWRSDCESNQCSPQNGTWQYDRAGFCPGDKVEAQNFSVLGFALPGNALQFSYELEGYVNQCSPNNSSCVNGVTCSDCNYNYNGHTEPFYYIGSQLIIHTTSRHSNADAYLSVLEQDSLANTIGIYLENYVPIYGISFKIDLNQLSNQSLENLSFQNSEGGRAQESGWTVSVNEDGLVIGLSQQAINPIQPGEGLFTQVQWNIEDITQISGDINISDVQISGYFGSELSFEIGSPKFFESTLSTPVKHNSPNKHMLHDAYPNPFNPAILLKYDLFQDSKVNISIFDSRGRFVKTLVNGSQKAGNRSVKWNATNDRNESVSAGLYIYIIQAGEFRQAKKMVLVK